MTQNRYWQDSKVVSMGASTESVSTNADMSESQRLTTSDKTPAESPYTRRRKVMFVIEALTVGGAEHMVVDLANEMALRGDIVHVVCLTLLGELSHKLTSDVTLHVLNKKPGIDPGLPSRLRALARRYDVDVVNSHLWTANLWTRIALYRSGVPVVVTEHNRDVWKRLHNRMLDRLLSHTTARMIAVSEDTANFYRTRVGVASHLITVVNNGVDTAKYASGNGAKLRPALAREQDFLIGTVGRLAIAKNHPRLVEAAGILRDQGVQIQVVIAGEGPERKRTEDKISELGLQQQVTLLGERSDVPDLLAALDVFVLSSDREGHPLSALEAQAAGTPVVLTDAGGSADAVSKSDTGSGGVLVERSAAALAVCLAELANQPRKLQEMSQFAQSYAVKYFDKSLMIDRYSAIFDAVQRSGITSLV